MPKDAERLTPVCGTGSHPRRQRQLFYYSPTSSWSTSSGSKKSSVRSKGSKSSSTPSTQNTSSSTTTDMLQPNMVAMESPAPAARRPLQLRALNVSQSEDRTIHLLAPLPTRAGPVRRAPGPTSARVAPAVAQQPVATSDNMATSAYAYMLDRYILGQPSPSPALSVGRASATIARPEPLMLPSTEQGHLSDYALPFSLYMANENDTLDIAVLSDGENDFDEYALADYMPDAATTPQAKQRAQPQHVASPPATPQRGPRAPRQRGAVQTTARAQAREGSSPKSPQTTQPKDAPRTATTNADSADGFPNTPLVRTMTPSRTQWAQLRTPLSRPNERGSDEPPAATTRRTPEAAGTERQGHGHGVANSPMTSKTTAVAHSLPAISSSTDGTPRVETARSRSLPSGVSETNRPVQPSPPSVRRTTAPHLAAANLTVSTHSPSPHVSVTPPSPRTILQSPTESSSYARPRVSFFGTRANADVPFRSQLATRLPPVVPQPYPEGSPLEDDRGRFAVFVATHEAPSPQLDLEGPPLAPRRRLTLKEFERCVGKFSKDIPHVPSPNFEAS